MVPIVSRDARKDLQHKNAATTNVTKNLRAVKEGDTAASAELLPLVYDKLRRLAARELRDDVSGNSVHWTALVDEAYVRLVD